MAVCPLMSFHGYAGLTLREIIHSYLMKTTKRDLEERGVNENCLKYWPNRKI